MRLVVTLCAALVFAGVGCGNDETEVPATSASAKPKPAPRSTAAAAASASAAAAAEAEREKSLPPLPVIQLSETDFVESDDTRDPFRDFRHVFLRKQGGDRAVQRNVKAQQYALDELKLVGIVTRSTQLVMLEDPTGFAWTVTTGEYVGKAELVKAGGGEGDEVAMNWRVDRIRPTDVVFIREDSAHPDIPPTTRVLPLYPDESTRPGG